MFDQCVRCIAGKGRLLVVGFASGRIPTLPVNMALIKGMPEVILVFVFNFDCFPFAFMFVSVLFLCHTVPSSFFHSPLPVFNLCAGH